MAVKYPKIKVRLTGVDGNAFAILGRVSNALKKAKVPHADREAFRAEATSDGYDHLIATCLEYVNVS